MIINNNNDAKLFYMKQIIRGYKKNLDNTKMSIYVL